jgi:hypothetical protein
MTEKELAEIEEFWCDEERRRVCDLFDLRYEDIADLSKSLRKAWKELHDAFKHGTGFSDEYDRMEEELERLKAALAKAHEWIGEVLLAADEGFLTLLASESKFTREGRELLGLDGK